MPTASINEHDYDDLPTVVSMLTHASVSQSISGNWCSGNPDFPDSRKTTPLKTYLEAIAPEKARYIYLKIGI